jgi:hypothetical protein
MRTVIFLGILGAITVGASEMRVPDEKRTEMSAVVFTGTVTNVEHLPLIRTNSAPSGIGPRRHDLGWWKVEVLVESVAKQDRTLGEVAVVYYLQQPIGLDGWATFEGRTSGYPKVEPKMRATFWCERVTVEGHTNVLCVLSPSWVRSK